MAYKFGQKQHNNVNQILANISKHLETDEEENTTSHILNHLKYQFPNSTEPPKVSSDQNIYGLQNLNQHATCNDDLTSLMYSGFKYSDSSMNMRDNRYDSASRNIYNPQYFGETSINNVAMEVVTSHENTFISRSSAENFYQQSSFNQGQYRSFTGEKQIAYDNSFPASMNFQYNTEATQTQRSNCGTYLQPQIQMLDPQHPNQWGHQLLVKDQSNGFKISRLNTWEPVQGRPRVSEERSSHNCYDLNCNLSGSDTFCMESRKRRKYDMFETLNNKCWIDSGTLMDLVNSKPPLVELPPLEDVSEEEEKQLTAGSGPQVNNIVTDVAIENNQISKDATDGEIKLPSTSMADSLTASEIKQHLSSFIQPNKDITPSDSENQCQLCSMDKLLLAPAPIYCSSCDLRIKQNAGYIQLESKENTNTQIIVCVSCFKIHYGSTVPKDDLQKATNDDEREDSWVQCDRCQHWQHRICGLYNDEKDEEGKAEYICPKCRLKEMENGDGLWLPHTVLGAKDLPRTNLSDHIEQRLFTRLKQEKEETAKFLGVELDKVLEAEGLVVRVVVSVDKELEVKQQFRDIFNGEYYPEKVPYRSKLILLFQRTGGVDLCIFGVYVQEFGSDCEGPNKRCVYISYLDSVKYFQPERRTATDESLRTFVYQEILIGYLEDCKKRGFATCYIWSCPLKKGEDYIFYCHPDTQKTPQKDKLRQWYKSILQKAVKEGIVVDQTNLYNQFFVPTREGNIKISASRLPYFDGDCWSTTAESISKVLDEEEKEEEKEKSGKTCNKLPTKRVLMLMEQDNPTKDALVMQRLGETIQREKENFMIVRLQHICTYCHELILSGSRWSCNQCNKIHLCSRCFHDGRLLSRCKQHTCRSGKKEWFSEDVVNDVPLDTKDKDDVLEYNVFESRDDFMNKCEKSIYQFDTLCNAKYSSMMILYHFTRSLIVQPKGDTCHTQNASHPPTEVTPEPQKQKVLTLKGALDVLVHSSRCNSMDCSNPDCRTIKKLIYHSSICTVRVRNGCEYCKRAWWIIREHSRICTDSDCKIHPCMDIRKKRAPAASSFENKQNLME